MQEKPECGHTCSLEDTQNLGTSDLSDLGDRHGVTEGNTDLRWGQALLGHLEDLLLDLGGGGLHPRRGSLAVRQSRAGDTLTVFEKKTCISVEPYAHIQSARLSNGLACNYPGVCMRPIFAVVGRQFALKVTAPSAHHVDLIRKFHLISLKFC